MLQVSTPPAWLHAGLAEAKATSVGRVKVSRVADDGLGPSLEAMAV